MYDDYLFKGNITNFKRDILSLYCTRYVFRILFTTTLHEGDYTKINLKSIESTTMEFILQYIYMRQIDINYDNVMDIMRTADYLCIDGLVQLCHEFVVECLGPDNCVTILQFAEYVLPILKKQLQSHGIAFPF